MRSAAPAAIDGYQRFISPYDGFSCAHRVRTVEIPVRSSQGEQLLAWG